jgi:hypothetical protein
VSQRYLELGDRFMDEGEGDPLILLYGIPTWGYLSRQADRGSCRAEHLWRLAAVKGDR